MNNDPLLGKARPWFVRCYRYWLVCYPRGFRQTYGQAMEQAFAERLAEERNGSHTARVRLLAREALSIAWTGLTQRLGSAWSETRRTLRVLGNAPGFVAVTVITLALGIGASSAIFSVVDGVLLEALPYEDPAELVYVGTTWGEPDPAFASIPEFLDWQERFGSLQSIAAAQPTSMVLTGGEHPERLTASRISASLLSILGAQPVLGRSFVPEEQVTDGPRVAILSHGLWTRRWGRDPGVIGTTFAAERGLSAGSYTVVGVLPPDFGGPAVLGLDGVDVLIPIALDGAARAGNRGGRSLRVLGRLKVGVSTQTAQEEANVVAAALAAEHATYRQEDFTVGIGVVPLKTRIAGGVERELLILLAASALLLLVACANVSNLLLSRTVGRQRELALRAAIGANRIALLKHLLAESLAIGMIGGITGIAVAAGAVEAFKVLAPSGFPRAAELTVDRSALAWAFGLAMLCGALSGLAPALFGSKDGVTAPMKGVRSSSSRSQARLRGALVVAETAMATLLLIGAGLLVVSFQKLRTVDPGFRTDGVLLTEIELGPSHSEMEQRADFLESLLERVRAIPGVQSASSVIDPPVGYVMLNPSIRLEGAPGQPRTSAAHIISPGYFADMDIPLLRGRPLEPADRMEQLPVAVVSLSMADELWAGDEPVGKKFKMSGHPEAPWVTVVGVVGDIHQENLESVTPREFYLAYAQAPQFRWTNIIVRSTETPATLEPGFRAAYREMDPNLPFRGLSRMRDRVEAAIASAQFRTSLLMFFAATALVLASAGLYGTLLNTVQRRTREIGIRMAIGAHPDRVLREVLRSGMTLAAIGMTGGVIAALAATRTLDRFLFGVLPWEPTVFTVVVAILATVAFGACLAPARRATRVDPASVLGLE